MMARHYRAAPVLCALALPAAAQTVILQLQVEGENAVHTAGAVSVRPLSVQVTDETGRPVQDAAVSFRLPEEDPTGWFRTGMKTELITTGPDGKAAVPAIRWGPVPGAVRIRVVAAKDQARAGALVSLYLGEPVAVRAADPPAQASRSRLRSRWLLAVAAAAGGGIAVSRLRQGRGAGGAPASSAAAAASVPALRIGAPAITVGRP